jgi:pyruvate formate lyase activating enzyme
MNAGFSDSCLLSPVKINSNPKFSQIVMKGIVFDIKRFCVHDGPGIRTTVFLKGCPLRCLWCHNPESQDYNIERVNNSITLDNRLFQVEEQIGREMTADQLVADIMRDAVFYDESGGGVTFSGGEPMLQTGFLVAALMACKELGLHTAVDTCGFAPAENFDKILPFTDLFLYDLKHPDPLQHQQLTGVDNKLILCNLEMLLRSNKKIFIRIPVVPGVNNSVETMKMFAAILKKTDGRVDQINLLPYHDMAGAKYSRLKKDVHPSAKSSIPEDEMTLYKKIFENENFKTKIGG